MRGTIISASIGVGAGLSLVWFITSLIQAEIVNQVLSAIVFNLCGGVLFAMLRDTQGLDRKIFNTVVVAALALAALAASAAVDSLYTGNEWGIQKISREIGSNVGTVAGGMMIFACFFLGSNLIKLIYRALATADERDALIKADYMRRWVLLAALLGGLVGLLI